MEINGTFQPDEVTVRVHRGRTEMEAVDFLSKILDDNPGHPPIAVWLEPLVGDPDTFQHFRAKPFRGLWLTGGQASLGEFLRDAQSARIDEARFFFPHGAIHLARTPGGYRLCAWFEDKSVIPIIPVPADTAWQTTRCFRHGGDRTRIAPVLLDVREFPDEANVQILEYTDPASLETIFWRIS